MDRRSFLAASAVVFAGCGQLPSTETSTPEPSTGTATPTSESPTATPTATEAETETRTPTVTETETETETRTPTETETPELTDREERAARFLDRAIAELNQAVYDYAGERNGSLLDVSAASSAVVRAAVFAELSDAEDHLDEARRLVSSRQQERLESVEDARQFIRLALDVQRPLIEAYGETQRGVEAVDDEAEGTIDAVVGELADRRSRTEGPLTRIRTETSAERVSVVPAIPADDYTGKVAQFEAERAGFGSLADFFERLREAVVDLQDARRFDRVDRERAARESAAAAAEAFETLATELEEFASGLSDDGASLVSVGDDLADIASAKAEDARELEERNQ